jgi:tripartite-type tricarboxylate transporter receptor subunit TctC
MMPLARLMLAPLTLAASICLVAPAAQAQTPADFYKGKNVQFIIPNAPGGSFDLYGRLVATHLGAFIPGHPSIIPQNMPGAGGMQAANYLYGIAPKDGTVLSVLVPNITLAQILDVQSITYDVRKLNWIGRAVATTSTLFTWERSATKKLADLKTKETLLATSGAVSQAEIDAQMLNGIVGTRFKLIRGYKGSAESAFAVERGEADGTLMPWEFLKAAHADWIAQGKISLVARFVRHPIAEHPEVPSVFELAQTPEQRDILNLFLGADEMGHPIAMPPGVPRDRVEAVRQAFGNMIKDEAFLADAKRQNLDLLPGRFDELENTVADAFAATPAEIEIARKYYRH